MVTLLRKSVRALRKLRQHRVIVLTYVAHASHLSQVLDRLIFRIFKCLLQRERRRERLAARESATKWRDATIKMSVDALHSACHKRHIQAAWKESGCWPCDSDQVINEDNFPDWQNTDLGTRPPPKKQARDGFEISARVLTASSTIDELERRAKEKK